MLDFFYVIIQAFGGKLRHDPDARKLIWILIITACFGISSVFFVAYIGYTRYHDMLGVLPYASTVALLFCVLVATFMFFGFSYVSSFTIDVWMEGKSRHSLKGAAILTVACIIVGIVDFNMNIDGAADVAEHAVSNVDQVNEESIKAKYADKLQELKREKQQILDKYYWKGKLYFEPYPVTRHPKSVWQIDKKKVDGLDGQIAEYEGLVLSDIQDAKSTYTTTLSERNDREDLVKSRLQTAVKGVYFVQFILTLIMSFIILKCMDALEENKAPTKPLVEIKPEKVKPQPAVFPGFAQGKDVVSSRDLNLLKRFEETLNQMESKLKPEDEPEMTRSFDRVNPGVNPPQDAGISSEDVSFLKKYNPVVKLVLTNQSTNEIINRTSVSRSTIKNVKRVMRAIKLIPEYSK